MSENKLVFCKELKTGQSEKSANTWPEILDQDGEIWRIFRQQVKPELNKAYLIAFHIKEKGFKDIDQITPVVNVFHQKALAETANRNDYIRNYSILLGYAKDLAVAGKIEPTIKAMYDWVQSRADAEMERLNPTNKEDVK